MAGLKRWIEPLVWALLAVALLAAGAFGWHWQQVRTVNATIADGGVEKIAPLPGDARTRYAAAWQAERAQEPMKAIAWYTDATSARNPPEAARAWFALGNVYFQLGIAESRSYEANVGPVWENAQFDLAREAYRSALRIEPRLQGARYNLELLERLSPVRHLAGWRRNTDPVMLEADKHNGWTSMQDDRKRGLP